MSNPLNPSEREKRETGFANASRPGDLANSSWSRDQYSTDHYLVPEEDVPVVPQERLFSRRVLFGWAFATLIVVFAITVILPMVVPIVKESVISSVMAQMKERGIHGTINGREVGPVIPAIPAIPGVPAVPDVPAIAGEPAPAAHSSPATGATPATPAPRHHPKAPAPATTDRR